MSVIPLQRVRLRFARRGDASSFSHLQQIDTLRRALAKSGWPVAMTGGKRPTPKVSFGPAISVGYESQAEYCDIELVSRLDFKNAKDQLIPHLPTGFDVMDIKSIPRFFPSLDQSLNVVRYEVASPLLRGTKEKWDDFLHKESFMVVKKKADRDVVVDGRACAKEWTWLAEDRLALVLRFGPNRTLKPERLIQAVCGLDESCIKIGTPDDQFKIIRTDLYLEKLSGELVAP